MRRVSFSLLLLAGLVGTGHAQSPTARDLLTAARRGDVGLLRRALEAGVPVDATDPTHQQTALIRAAMFGQAEAAGMLVAAGADVERAAAPEGMRALHWAARQGSPDVVRILLDARARAEVADGIGSTPLEHALRAGSVAAVEALLAAGASPETLRDPLSRLIGPALNPDVPGPELDALIAVIRRGRGLERDSGMAGERTALLALAGRANRPGAERVAEALVAGGANLRATDEQGRTARQIVEAWVPTQRDPRYRKTLEAVLAVLRQAEARR